MRTPPLLDQLTAATADRLRQSGVPRSVARGSAVFHEGDRSAAAFLVTTGLLKAVRGAGGGRVVLLGLRGRGAILGEQGVLDDQPRSASVIAIEDSEVLTIDGRVFKKILADHSDLAMALLQLLSRRLRETSGHLANRSAADPGANVAGRIIDLIDNEALARIAVANGAPIAVRLPISQQELADWVGLSREGVVKTLRSFREAGWIETARKQVIIHDFDALRSRAALDGDS